MVDEKPVGPEIVTFTVTGGDGDFVVRFESGMTWNQFFISGYNGDGMSLDNPRFYFDGTDSLIYFYIPGNTYYLSSDVNPNDIISPIIQYEYFID